MSTTEYLSKGRKRARKKSHYPTPFNSHKIAWALLALLVLGVFAIKHFGW
jgi:hypothetical protein